MIWLTSALVCHPVTKLYWLVSRFVCCSIISIIAFHSIGDASSPCGSAAAHAWNPRVSPQRHRPRTSIRHPLLRVAGRFVQHRAATTRLSSNSMHQGHIPAATAVQHHSAADVSSRNPRQITHPAARTPHTIRATSHSFRSESLSSPDSRMCESYESTSRYR